MRAKTITEQMKETALTSRRAGYRHGFGDGVAAGLLMAVGAWLVWQWVAAVMR